MAKRSIVLGNNLVDEYYSKYPSTTELRQAFAIDHSIEYDFGDLGKGIYKLRNTMLMMDDAMETDDIRISITWYGEFYFPKGKGISKKTTYLVV